MRRITADDVNKLETLIDFFQRAVMPSESDQAIKVGMITECYEWLNEIKSS